MRILIHGLNYAPELVGIGKYTGEMAEWLASRGHQVRVVTSPPYYPEWEIAKGYAGCRYERETIKGVDVFRCPLWVPRKTNGLKRVMHLASFAMSGLPMVLFQAAWSPDLVVAIEPAFFSIPGALMTARLAKAETWLHVQDFEIDAAFSLGLLSGEKVRKSVDSTEAWFLSRFSRVSTISDRMMEGLHLKGVAKENTVLFPNWVDTEQIYPLERRSPMKKELGIPSETIVALYSGNMGEKQGLDIIVDAARRLRHREDLLFIMCGAGAASDRLRRHASGLANITWLPLQPMDKLNNLLNLADIHLLPQRAGAEDLVMPSKLTGMLASGRPIVATALPGTEIWKAVQGRGIVVSPGDAEAFVQAIESLVEKPEERIELGKAARLFSVENLEKEAVLCRLEEKLLELVKEKSKKRPLNSVTPFV